MIAFNRDEKGGLPVRNPDPRQRSPTFFRATCPAISSARTSSQAYGWSAPFELPLRSRTSPSASDRTELAGVPVRHTDPRSALVPPNAASEWQPSLPACSASVASSCVRSVTLADGRCRHFQLRQDRLESLTSAIWRSTRLRELLPTKNDLS